MQEEKYRTPKVPKLASNHKSNFQTFVVSSTTSSNLPLLLKPQSNIPLKRLSSSELQEWKENGLCYRCDEKFLPDHKCKSILFLFLHQDDNIPDKILHHKISLCSRLSAFFPLFKWAIIWNLVPEKQQISLQEMLGNSNLETLHITKNIQK